VLAQATNRVVLFGGERDGGGVLDDLWTLKGADREVTRTRLAAAQGSRHDATSAACAAVRGCVRAAWRSVGDRP
jgi:hypothetical protein